MLSTTEKLAELAQDCLENEGDPAMIAPMLKTARVLTDAELKTVAGGPRIVNDTSIHPYPRISNE